MFQEAELRNGWRSLGTRVISGKGVLGAVTLGSKAQHSFVIVLNIAFSLSISLCPAPSLSTQQRGCCSSLFMRMTRELSRPWVRGSPFLCAVIWTFTIKPLKIAPDATGYSSLQCNLKKLTVQLLKYLCHIDMVYNAWPFMCFKPCLLPIV